MTDDIVLSVVDQSPMRKKGSGADALRETVRLAQAVERFGYGRPWVAEHHNSGSFAGSSPEVVVGQIAASTTAFCRRTRPPPTLSRKRSAGSWRAFAANTSTATHSRSAMKSSRLPTFYSTRDVGIVTNAYAYEDWVRSYRIVAEAFGLTPVDRGVPWEAEIRVSRVQTIRGNTS